MANAAELQALKQAVYEANMLLVQWQLVVHTWGNASGISADRQYMVIKPSGVSYHELEPAAMVVVELATGAVVNSSLRPSSDAPTHRALYLHDPQLQGIVHTHSSYATSWAQAGLDLPCLGTTHADHFAGPIPCTRLLKPEEIVRDYEYNTGMVIIEEFTRRQLSFATMPAVLVRDHGPFILSTTSALAAATLARTLETIAQMAFQTQMLNPHPNIEPALFKKHYHRKHGAKAYYGQPPVKSP